MFSHDFVVEKGFSQGFAMEEVFSPMVLGAGDGSSHHLGMGEAFSQGFGVGKRFSHPKTPTLGWWEGGWGVLGGESPALHPSSGTLWCRGAVEMSYRIPCTKCNFVSSRLSFCWST